MPRARDEPKLLRANGRLEYGFRMAQRNLLIAQAVNQEDRKLPHGDRLLRRDIREPKTAFALRFEIRNDDSRTKQRLAQQNTALKSTVVVHDLPQIAKRALRNHGFNSRI